MKEREKGKEREVGGRKESEGREVCFFFLFFFVM